MARLIAWKRVALRALLAPMLEAMHAIARLGLVSCTRPLPPHLCTALVMQYIQSSSGRGGSGLVHVGLQDMVGNFDLDWCGRRPLPSICLVAILYKYASKEKEV